MGLVWDLTGHAQSARSNPVRGLSRDLTGRAPGFERVPYGHARDAPWHGRAMVALAQNGPDVPVVPRTNPAQDQSGNVIWVA